MRPLSACLNCQENHYENYLCRRHRDRYRLKISAETETTTVLVDCGLFQGYKWLRERNWQTLPLDIDKLDAVLLTHAHLDHSVISRCYTSAAFAAAVFTITPLRPVSDFIGRQRPYPGGRRQVLQQT
ncbi:MBL fold metallo-hydrolase [Halopseudomonas pachastrellae]|nr:MBL fold metallo-hydrolase [Halopseudomonas pachastrellae]